ncbi:hypothetical protein AFA91_09960 [Mycolicibacterium goodii]|uniref:Uncharacterized protein n=1 Tax=Mycolicibacterium goodii TaxID=134601 RepID=A0A0K0XFQ2_MYCGD|nr:hypothetical protein AFA91_09960 [Mycolicibacterium goodii]
MYCSPACRQKAHRARTARRVAALSRQRSDATSGDVKPVAVRPDIARSLERAREQIAESRRLCRISAERLRRMAALQREIGNRQEVRATTPMPYAKWAR